MLSSSRYVRCDALYQSYLEPWSKFLTVSRARLHCLIGMLERNYSVISVEWRFIAWINPYRAKHGSPRYHPRAVRDLNLCFSYDNCASQSGTSQDREITAAVFSQVAADIGQPL